MEQADVIILIREGLIDCDYITRHVSGFDEYATFVKDFAPTHVAAVTGLTEAQIMRVALLYGRARSAFIGWTMGVNHSTQGAVTVTAINNLSEQFHLNAGQIGLMVSVPTLAGAFMRFPLGVLSQYIRAQKRGHR